MSWRKRSGKLNIFFDRNSLNLSGWKTTDSYSNKVNFLISNIETNISSFISKPTPEQKKKIEINVPSLKSAEIARKKAERAEKRKQMRLQEMRKRREEYKRKKLEREAELNRKKTKKRKRLFKNTTGTV